MIKNGHFQSPKFGKICLFDTLFSVKDKDQVY